VGFASRSTDTIAWLPNAQGIAIARNLFGSDRVGIEGGSGGSLGPLQWSTSLTLTRSRLRDAEGVTPYPQPGLPPWEWHHRLGPRLGPITVGHTLDGGGPTALDGAGIGFTGARWIHGAWVAGQWRAWRIELEAANLLDRRTEVGARDPLVADGLLATRSLVDFAGYPLPGRTWWVTLQLIP